MIKPGETVFDLGCGDGRVLITAAQSSERKGIGVELSANLVRMTNDQVKRLNLENLVKLPRAACSTSTCSPPTS